MTFEEWMRKNNYSLSGIDELDAEFLIGEAWKEAYRQGYKDSQVTVKKIDDSEQVINRMRHKNPRYKRWLELNYESE